MNRKDNIQNALSDEVLIDKIYLIRGQRIILDRDLAQLYNVETRVLKQAVRRNIDRFPEDFMFEMSDTELKDWRSQNVISNLDKKGLRYSPFCFTEQGVAMLSSVLNSKLAIQINIQIMRIFTRIRQFITDNTQVQLEIAELRNAVEILAKKQNSYDKSLDVLFNCLDLLQEKTEIRKQKEIEKIGFIIGNSK
ncbi:ORF6N domain [Sphingobacterium spiritivorum]|uniref:ORF6N domain n=1 Tax=Sphingobacterium spiritivorum TaxID=258 RepID=A0A380CXR5_SPHSI|nr:ORF6N domain-containing protein [Sphingobacterium spiritivorum]SUJ30517.1 ORF6N domain [Sphingobacterium spiritivorum]